LVPFFFAAFISTLASSFVAWLQRYRVPQYLALFLVLVLSIALLAVVVVLVGNSVSVFTESIPSYREEFKLLATPIKDWFHRHQLDIVYSTFLSSLEPSAIMDMLTTGLRKLMTAFSGTLIMLFIMIFIMSEAASFKKKLHAAFGDSASISRLEEIAGDVQRYLAIKTLTSSVTGLAVGIMVYLAGLDFAVLWGFRLSS